MSLDIYLMHSKPVTKVGTGVFVRDDGKTRELTIEEVRERFPDAEVEERADESREVYWRNITHNLTAMADAAGIYYALWRPEEIGSKKASDIAPLLANGLEKLEADPDKFKKLNPENGWGSYDGLVEAVREYWEACKEYPDATIEVSR